MPPRSGASTPNDPGSATWKAVESSRDQGERLRPGSESENLRARPSEMSGSMPPAPEQQLGTIEAEANGSEREYDVRNLLTMVSAFALGVSLPRAQRAAIGRAGRMILSGMQKIIIG